MFWKPGSEIQWFEEPVLGFWFQDDYISLWLLFFCGVEVLHVEDALHLGNVVGSGRMQKSIKRAVSDLNQRTNVLLSRFSFCSPDVKYRFFKSQCLVAYGSQLWDFDSRVSQKFFTCLRVNVRRLWGLPPTTHCHLLPGVCVFAMTGILRISCFLDRWVSSVLPEIRITVWWGSASRWQLMVAARLFQTRFRTFCISSTPAAKKLELNSPVYLRATVMFPLVHWYVI